MQGIIDISKIVGKLTINEQAFEVCAEADASFDRASSQLSVKLHSYLHPEEQTHLMEAVEPDWLPAPSTVTEHVSQEEASIVAKDIFASWCHKVEAAVAQQTPS